MLGPIMVWMHYELLGQEGHALSLGQRIGGERPCFADHPCSDECGWASLTRLIHRPSDWIEATGVEPEVRSL